MITRYLTSLHAQFAPLSKSKAHRVSRLMLSFLPANATSPAPSGLGMKISKTILSSTSPEPARIVVQLKGGDEVVFQEEKSGSAAAAGNSAKAAAGANKSANTFNLAKMSIDDITQELDRRSRKLARAEELS